ncbi:TonB-dependent receptor domain-containing protein [Burkholderiaceae bacterium UC74_6]
MKLNTLARSLVLLGLGSSLLGVAHAQTDAAAPEQKKIERVEVTGSSIKRIQDEGALPLQIISRDEIQRQGITSAEQLLSVLSANANSADNLASNADVVTGAARGTNGASSANLRGQGSASTLILLNGRRVASYGLNGGAVDLNQIPLSAIERVEVLKDGASAVYGTDAIGGVINFILRKNYQGLQAQTFADVTQQGGGNIYQAKVLGGFGDLEKDKFNVLVSVARSEAKALRGDQRDFVNTFQPDRGLSVDTRGAPYATAFAVTGINSLLSANSTGPSSGGIAYNGINPLAMPGQAGCASIDGQQNYDAVIWNSVPSKYGCAWDTGRAAVLQQPVKTTNLVSHATFQLGEHQLNVEFVGSKVNSDKSFSPNQISTSGTASSLVYGAAYNYLPGDAAGKAVYDSVYNALLPTFPSLAARYSATNPLPIAFRWRCMPCGNRELETDSTSTRVLVSADGPLPFLSGWDYKSGLSRATNDSSSVLKHGFFYGKTPGDTTVAALGANGAPGNLATTRPFSYLLYSGLLNPFSANGTQTAAAMQALDALRADGVKLYGGKYTLTQGDVGASGPLFKMPTSGQDVMLALGVDGRIEEYRFNGNESDLNTQAAIYNAPFDSVNTLAPVKRKVLAEYGEVLVPILKNLEGNVAVRRDDYTGFGSTVNPKYSIRYAPTESVVLRASKSKGFRVPVFSQLFYGVTESQYVGKDLVDPAKCPSGVVSATDPNCASITPNIFTGGKPTLGPERSRQWTAGIVISPFKDTTASLDWWSIHKVGTIQSIALSDMVKNYNLFTAQFLRDGSGNIVAIDQRWVNAGESITRGLDVTFRQSMPFAGGKLTTILDGTYLLEKRSRLLTNAPMGPSEVGTWTRTGDLGLRWKHALTFTYTNGDWVGSLGQLFRSGYIDQVLPGVANGSVKPANWSPDVRRYITYNASVGYKGVKDLTVTLGIKNLLNTDPPFTVNYDSNSGAGSSWEPRVADPRGRAFTFTVDYKFL